MLCRFINMGSVNSENKKKDSHDEVAVELQPFEKIDKNLLPEPDMSREERARFGKGLGLEARYATPSLDDAYL
jgi:hypothetical protein